ncbi:cholesterol transport system auxiliary component [Cohaesibacter sp. ES.047]|uniref:ABC-type transport auxiliary lipoprotein family protein n=1 Tax=Cohaesibacter sp. ES.047 TaxID=1798205 RepID=UPI000BB85B78|nr:ABC-type transport auxiliary lipoprotein family protein [Cohaesibacter sp. ES.047]SNY94308.1 cholesterol transport system auxiliary component [Cohaesibacter sp. ES.047]
MRHLAIVSLCLLTASCAAVVGKKELATYDLSAPTSFAEISGQTNAQLLVSIPTALKSLDSEMIVVRPGGAEITYFGDGQWNDKLPVLLQDKIIRTLENSNRVRSVVKPGDGVVVDYKIATTIRAFELVNDKGSIARVSLSVKIINDRTGRVRASRLFTATAPASLANTKKAVASLDVALDSVLRQLLVWVLKTI